MAKSEAGGAFTAVQLKDLVGERIGPWKQTELDVPLESRRLAAAGTLVYGFRNGKQKATLTVSDGGAENSAPGPAHWTGPPNRRETPSGAEFVYREGRHTVREIERRDAAGPRGGAAAGQRHHGHGRRRCRHEGAEGARRRRADRRRRGAGPAGEVTRRAASPRSGTDIARVRPGYGLPAKSIA